uniref:DUF6848 domain-containing protein n=1 Tax=Geobacter sp. (strain M21) TaxID=443144 RepID=C6E6Q3_GEOSM
MSNALPKEVTEAQEKGITVLQLEGENGELYYFGKPGREDMNRYIATAAKGKPAQAVRNLVIDKAIYPPGPELAKQFEENPGRMVALNSALQGEVGMNEEFTAKKL